MTEHHRELLTSHWSMLMKYLNPTEAMIDALVADKVIPPSMGDDIRVSKTQKEKNERILTSLKIIGSNAFGKFRHILLEHGHAFLAELLWEDSNGSCQFIEECDFDNYPSFKDSLNPLERNQLIRILDSKIKTRLLKSEWRNCSEDRIKKLQVKIANDRKDTDDLKKKIAMMKADLSLKNDSLKTVIKDFNTMNDDVVNFEQRHQKKMKGLLPLCIGGGDHYILKGPDIDVTETAVFQNSRFKFLDNIINVMDQRLSTLLGEGETKAFVSVQELEEKTVRVKEMIREMEVKMDTFLTSKNHLEELLFPNEPDELGATLIQTVQKYISREQNKRVTLLKDIDNLSRKIRNVKKADANSGLLGLKQSAVTGYPAPEMVDHRFLRNHIALLNADAEHMHKRFHWLEEEVDELKKYVKKSSSAKPILQPIK